MLRIECVVTEGCIVELKDRERDRCLEVESFAWLDGLRAWMECHLQLRRWKNEPDRKLLMRDVVRNRRHDGDNEDRFLPLVLDRERQETPRGRDRTERRMEFVGHPLNHKHE